MKKRNETSRDRAARLDRIVRPCALNGDCIVICGFHVGADRQVAHIAARARRAISRAIEQAVREERKRRT